VVTNKALSDVFVCDYIDSTIMPCLKQKTSIKVYKSQYMRNSGSLLNRYMFGKMRQKTGIFKF